MKIKYYKTIPYNQNALIELPSPFPEGMLPVELVQPTLIIIDNNEQDGSATTTYLRKINRTHHDSLI